jgi:hypothetical protein
LATKEKQEGLMIPFLFWVFTLFLSASWISILAKLLLIEFLTNLLQDFFLGLEGKNSESCFLPKERRTETVSDFFFCLWVKQQPLGFIACYFIFSGFVGADGVYSPISLLPHLVHISCLPAY